LAAIDVGTNSIRCIVVEAAANGGFRVLDDEKATVRLGQGLTASGTISSSAWERSREALLRMRKIADGLGAGWVEAVATSAVRRASNGMDFVEDMARTTGVRLRIVDGEEEAELAALSAWHHFDMHNSRYALMDIGGGSVEVVTAAGDHIEEIYSLDLGAVVLTEEFVTGDPLPKADFDRLRLHVHGEIFDILGGERPGIQLVIGSGGTVTTIANMVMARRGERYGSLHGYEVLHSEIVHLLPILHRRTLKQRRALPGLSPERADIIVAGVVVVDQVLRALGANMLKINERGIREGLILRSLEKHGLLPGRDEGRDWRSSVVEFARSCHADLVHGEQVGRLAGVIFDALAGRFGLEARSRQLLEAAALLHDVGYFISYSKHHKHSYHLIRHAHLYDISPWEKEIIANLARYHRKALPKTKHANFGQLGPDDRALVGRLGGILRLADGLDRRRSNAVQNLDCTLSGGVLALGLTGEEDLSVEIYGGREKGDLLTRAFGVELEITAEGARSGSK
jgi:exopolyphosphatase/guanosine-5'-triphosphate,3'-diphosphate pyrophosphatase